MAETKLTIITAGGIASFFASIESGVAFCIGIAFGSLITYIYGKYTR